MRREFWLFVFWDCVLLLLVGWYVSDVLLFDVFVWWMLCNDVWDWEVEVEGENIFFGWFCVLEVFLVLVKFFVRFLIFFLIKFDKSEVWEVVDVMEFEWVWVWEEVLGCLGGLNLGECILIWLCMSFCLLVDCCFCDIIRRVERFWNVVFSWIVNWLRLLEGFCLVERVFKIEIEILLIDWNVMLRFVRLSFVCFISCVYFCKLFFFVFDFVIEMFFIFLFRLILFVMLIFVIIFVNLFVICKIFIIFLVKLGEVLRVLSVLLYFFCICWYFIIIDWLSIL